LIPNAYRNSRFADRLTSIAAIDSRAQQRKTSCEGELLHFPECFNSTPQRSSSVAGLRVMIASTWFKSPMAFSSSLQMALAAWEEELLLPKQSSGEFEMLRAASDRPRSIPLRC
jgi:hypothetical protein